MPNADLGQARDAITEIEGPSVPGAPGTVDTYKVWTETHPKSGGVPAGTFKVRNGANGSLAVKQEIFGGYGQNLSDLTDWIDGDSERAKRIVSMVYVDTSVNPCDIREVSYLLDLNGNTFKFFKTTASSNSQEYIEITSLGSDSYIYVYYYDSVEASIDFELNASSTRPVENAGIVEGISAHTILEEFDVFDEALDAALAYLKTNVAKDVKKVYCALADSFANYIAAFWYEGNFDTNVYILRFSEYNQTTGETKDGIAIGNTGSWVKKVNVPTSRTIAGLSLESDISENALFDKMNIKGRYATLSALQTANPDHGYCYLVEADNHWYYWNGSAWTDGGVHSFFDYCKNIENTVGGIAIKSLYTLEANGGSRDFSYSGAAGKKYYFKVASSEKYINAGAIYLFRSDGTYENATPSVWVGNVYEYVPEQDFVKIRFYLTYNDTGYNNVEVQFGDYDLKLGNDISKTLNRIIGGVFYDASYTLNANGGSRDFSYSGAAGKKYYFKVVSSERNLNAGAIYLFRSNNTYETVTASVRVGNVYEYVPEEDFVKIRFYLTYSDTGDNNVEVQFGDYAFYYQNLSQLSEEVFNLSRKNDIDYISGIMKPNVIGDSLSAGLCYVPNSSNKVLFEASWEYVLFKKKRGTNVNYIGRSGARAIDIINEFSSELANIGEYDVHIVFLGTNLESDNIGTINDIVDNWDDTPTDTCIGRYSKLLKTIDHYSSPNSIKIACGLVPSSFSARNDYIKLVADNISGWIYANTNEYEYLYKTLENNNDGTHFTPIGYSDLVKIMELAINKALKENPNLVKNTGGVN